MDDLDSAVQGVLAAAETPAAAPAAGGGGGAAAAAAGDGAVSSSGLWSLHVADVADVVRCGFHGNGTRV